MRYAQIRDELLGKINSGELKPGDRLPPEIELSEKFDTSRATVAKALGELERAGLLTRRRGAGTFIKQPVQEAAPALRLAMFTGWAMQGQPIGFFQTHVHSALSALCAEHGAELSLQGLAAGKDYRAQLFHAADQILARNTNAVCFCPAELSHEEMGVNRELVDYLANAGCKTILIDRDIVGYPQRSELPWVAFDNRRGATLLTRHVIDAGYKRIAFVGISADSTAVEERLAGYTDALRIAGRPVDRKLVFAVDTVQPEPAFVRRMLKDARPDAIIAKDVLFAAHIGSVLLSDGLRIGPDVGLAGFDDNPAASVLHVPLTIVRQPVEPFVNAIYQMVLRVLADTYVTGEHIVIPTELVVRESTSLAGDHLAPAGERASTRLSRAT